MMHCTGIKLLYTYPPPISCKIDHNDPELS
jgi:hypothetical protein